MLPSTAIPQPLQQASGLRKVEVTQAAIAALTQHTSPEICAFKRADPIIQELLGFWQQKQRPSHEERAQLSQSTLSLLRQWVEKDGILWWCFSCASAVAAWCAEKQGFDPSPLGA